MKERICTLAGITGSAIAAAFGGWDAAMMALTVLVALVFHNRLKSETGAYNSTYGLKGLCKKCMMLLFVLVAVQIDRLMGSDYIRDAVCIGFSINEILSITENLGLAGIPMPKVIVSALEQLQKKA